MKRPLLIWVGVVVLFFIILTFLNCGHEADAMPRNERVERNKVASSSFTVSSSRQQRQVEGRCKRADATYSFDNHLNQNLIRYTLHVSWCYDGKHVTSARWQPEYNITHYWWNNWQWEGAQTPIRAGCSSGQCAYAFERHKGTFGVNVLWFHHSITPYVQCTVRGDGSYQCGKGS
jgi:hypothetical protein